MEEAVHEIRNCKLGQKKYRFNCRRENCFAPLLHNYWETLLSFSSRLQNSLWRGTEGTERKDIFDRLLPVFFRLLLRRQSATPATVAIQGLSVHIIVKSFRCKPYINLAYKQYGQPKVFDPECVISVKPGPLVVFISLRPIRSNSCRRRRWCLTCKSKRQFCVLAVVFNNNKSCSGSSCRF